MKKDTFFHVKYTYTALQIKFYLNNSVTYQFLLNVFT